MSIPIKISELPTLFDEQVDGGFFLPVAIVDELGIAVSTARISIAQLAGGILLPFDRISLGDSVPDGKILISQDGGLVLTDYITQSQIDDWDDAYSWGDHALAGYALAIELANKQDTLVSGTNIKTVNGESILGSGNIVISTGVTSLGGLSDVTLSSTANGQSIVFNGTNFVNSFINYNTLTNRPSTFPPSAHVHIIANITGLQTALDSKQEVLVSGTNIKTINGESILGSGNIAIAGGGGSIALDDLSDVVISSSTTGQAVLFNGTNYVNAFVDYSTIINKPATFTPSAHTHVIGDVTGLQTALDNKQPVDGDLTAIAALSGTNGLLRKTNSNTWAIDTTAYAVDVDLVKLTGNQTIAGVKEFSNVTKFTVTDESFATPLIISSGLTLNLALSNNFVVQHDASVALLTISNAPAARAFGFTLRLEFTGPFTLNWPASIRWQDGTPPSLTSISGKADVFSFYTTDGGTTYYGFLIGENL